MVIERLRRRPSAAWVIGAVGLLASLALAVWVQRAESARERERFERQADIVASVVRTRLSAHVALLRSAAGLFAASANVRPEEFEAFVGAMDLEDRYPGMQGVGFAAALADPRGRAEAVADLAPAGVRPAPEAQSAIVFLQPLDSRNRAALAYDMLGEPVRREAMLRSRAERQPAVTAPVVLVQEIDSAQQPGFLLYLALEPGPDGRFPGWAYAPFRAHDFFEAVLSDPSVPRDVTVTIRDEAAQDAPLWPPRPPQARPDGLSATRYVIIGGRTWHIGVSSRSGGGMGLTPLLVLLVGLLLTAALSLAWRWQGVALEEARRARQRTELLLGEINHRAANSLQLVASFVYLQAQAVRDPKARAALVETRARILAVSRVHQRLYTDDSVEGVELKGYLESLTEGLADAFAAGGRRLTVEATTIRVPTDRAIAVGVALVELVSNAAKYAYAEGEPGDIRVRLSHVGGVLRLQVEDDGVGFDPGPRSKARGSGLGMKVVRAMATKLGGELTVEPGAPGARVTLAFPAA